MKKIITLFSLLLLSLTSTAARSLTPTADQQLPSLTGPEVVTLGTKMPAFTLPTLQGTELSLADYKGKRLLLIFPRGKVDDDWCQICHYQYAELVDFDQRTDFRAQHNIEIVFVLPYSMAEVKEWSTLFPHQMQVIESWKNPKDPASLSEGQKRFSREVRELLPHQFSYVPGEEIPLPFPIVVDANRTLAKRMGLFTTEWEGSKADQMVPTVFLLDESGVVQFKYYSQSSFDRPHPTYLQTYITKIMTDK